MNKSPSKSKQRLPPPLSPNRETSEVFGGARNGGRRFRLDCFLPTRVVFPADIWEDVMGYRCRDACGLAAAVSKVRRRPIAAGELDDSGDTESDGDVELGDFISRTFCRGSLVPPSDFLHFFRCSSSCRVLPCAWVGAGAGGGGSTGILVCMWYVSGFSRICLYSCMRLCKRGMVPSVV